MAISRWLGAGVLVVAAGMATACATLLNQTQQNVNLSSYATPGMTPSQVQSMMNAPPAKADFYANVIEWHYCKTGYGADQFVAYFFRDGRLVESRNYTVTIDEAGGATGDCSLFVRRGNYRDPDWVAEIRRR